MQIVSRESRAKYSYHALSSIIVARPRSSARSGGVSAAFRAGYANSYAGEKEQRREWGWGQGQEQGQGQAALLEHFACAVRR